MRTKLLIAVLALLACSGCGPTEQAGLGAQDLEPIDSALTYHTPAYHTQLRQHLLKKATASELQFLMLPSFEPELLLSIYEVAGRCVAQIVKPEQQIWARVVEPKHGKVEDIACKILEKNLPEAIGARLRSLWQAMLSRTRYQDDVPQVLDGISYMFLDRLRGGETNSPDEGTRPFQFAEIGTLVVSYVEAEPGKQQELLAKLVEQMDVLDALLAKADRAGAGK